MHNKIFAFVTACATAAVMVGFPSPAETMVATAATTTSLPVSYESAASFYDKFGETETDGKYVVTVIPVYNSDNFQYEYETNLPVTWVIDETYYPAGSDMSTVCSGYRVMVFEVNTQCSLNLSISTSYTDGLNIDGNSYNVGFSVDENNKITWDGIPYSDKEAELFLSKNDNFEVIGDKVVLCFEQDYVTNNYVEVSDTTSAVTLSENAYFGSTSSVDASTGEITEISPTSCHCVYAFDASTSYIGKNYIDILAYNDTESIGYTEYEAIFEVYSDGSVGLDVIKPFAIPKSYDDAVAFYEKYGEYATDGKTVVILYPWINSGNYKFTGKIGGTGALTSSSFSLYYPSNDAAVKQGFGVLASDASKAGSVTCALSSEYTNGTATIKDGYTAYLNIDSDLNISIDEIPTSLRSAQLFNKENGFFKVSKNKIIACIPVEYAEKCTLADSNNASMLSATAYSQKNYIISDDGEIIYIDGISGSDYNVMVFNASSAGDFTIGIKSNSESEQVISASYSVDESGNITLDKNGYEAVPYTFEMADELYRSNGGWCINNGSIYIVMPEYVLPFKSACTATGEAGLQLDSTTLLSPIDILPGDMSYTLYKFTATGIGDATIKAFYEGFDGEPVDEPFDDVKTFDFTVSQNGFIVRNDEATIVVGDANCSGSVDVADVVAVRRYLVSSIKYPLSEQGAINADIQSTGNGINAQDAVAIQKSILGL